jgi:Putative Actinobacterial Holin-X, holin superfamily III
MVHRMTDLSHDEEPSESAGARAATLLDLLHRLTEQLSTLFRQEVQLAAAEISRSLTTLFLSLASVASGGAVLYAGFVLLLLAAVFGLANVVPLWLASLSIGTAVAIVGCVLLAVGKRKLRASDLIPTHSPASLSRDKDVLTREAS